MVLNFQLRRSFLENLLVSQRQVLGFVGLNETVRKKQPLALNVCHESREKAKKHYIPLRTFFRGMGVQEEAHDYINLGIDWLRIFDKPLITAQPSIMRAVNHSPGHFDAIVRVDFNIMNFYEVDGMGYKPL